MSYISSSLLNTVFELRLKKLPWRKKLLLLLCTAEEKQPSGVFYKKEVLETLFFWEFWEIFKNSFFYRTTPVIVSGRSIFYEASLMLRLQQQRAWEDVHILVNVMISVTIHLVILFTRIFTIFSSCCRIAQGNVLEFHYANLKYTFFFPEVTWFMSQSSSCLNLLRL